MVKTETLGHLLDASSTQRLFLASRPPARPFFSLAAIESIQGQGLLPSASASPRGHQTPARTLPPSEGEMGRWRRPSAEAACRLQSALEMVWRPHVTPATSKR